jgi:hypothetical protein
LSIIGRLAYVHKRIRSRAPAFAHVEATEAEAAYLVRAEQCPIVVCKAKCAIVLVYVAWLNFDRKSRAFRAEHRGGLAPSEAPRGLNVRLALHENHAWTGSEMTRVGFNGEWWAEFSLCEESC